MSIPTEKLVDMYRTILRIRNFEERVSKEFAAGNLPGFVHLSIGEEAIATGACACLRRDDYITSYHRGHGHLIAKGGKIELMMAELYGKRTGYSKGKGGSMHMSDVGIGELGANGIVGAGIPIAAGAALSAKLRGTDQVVICFFGDGATNTSRFHEGINLASIWKLPVVFVIENNTFACSTSISYSANIGDLADRAAAYGIPGKTIDGNDVLIVYEAVGEAIDRARKGEGPTLIGCKTCRHGGHFEGEEQSYRTAEEIEECKKRDPIPRFRKKLIEMKALTEKEAEEINQEILEELEKAVKFAEKSPPPDPEEVLTDICA
ncbi:thiamine pyrophosphate-dependent dehydrogenase E1 component subunit alpha [Chloroflexota bacterium]